MKIGFIGMGNMAQALVSGLIKYGKAGTRSINAFAPNQIKLKENADKIGFTPAATLTELVEGSDIIILACKPCHMDIVLGEIRDLLKGKVVISVVLGWNFKKWQSEQIKEARFQFVMPNISVATGEGVMSIFESAGLVAELPASLMGIGGTISGCGPAFVDLFIESYADAAVKYGISREIAYKLVSATVLGAAKLQLMTGEHPAVLKDKVCSPGGSTIKGVTALEREGLRRACQASIDEIMKMG